MSGTMWLPAAVSVLLFLFTGIAECGNVPDCDCDYHAEGCVISSAASAGFTCKCSYEGDATCGGTVSPCNDNDQCPGGQADYCACKLGGGNCGGYSNPHDDCDVQTLVQSPPSGDPTCGCVYHSGGCVISNTPLEGHKCVCIYNVFTWKCSGWVQRCDKDEQCPANDRSREACLRGGGDCGGYSGFALDMDYFTGSETCNCTRAIDWRNGKYTITNVKYDLKGSHVDPLPPVTVSEKTIKNYCTETQTINFEVQEIFSETSSFNHTGGIAIQNGVNFSAGIPYLASMNSSIRLTASLELTFGQSLTITNLFKSAFTCNGASHKPTLCSVMIHEGLLNVSYIMEVKNNFIQNCTCESYGFWSGVQHFDAELIAKEQ